MRQYPCGEARTSFVVSLAAVLANEIEPHAFSSSGKERPYVGGDDPMVNVGPLLRYVSDIVRT
jgi:hypothetical protein